MLSKDEIIEMARQAGFLYGTMEPSNTRFVTAIGHTFTVELEAFAKLVADVATAKEREEIAQFIDSTELGSLPEATAIVYARLLKSYSTAIRARNNYESQGCK